MDDFFERHYQSLRKRVSGQSHPADSVENMDKEQLQTELSIHTEELQAQFEDLERSRDELAQLSQKLLRIFQSMPNGIIIVDEQTSEIIEINQQAYKLLDEKHNFSKKTLAGYFSKSTDFSDSRYQSFFQWFADNNNLKIELQRVNGQWLQLEKTPCDAQGLLVTLVDITSIRQAELKIRQTNRLLSTFVENAPAAIAMFDNDMNYINASRLWRSNRNLPEDIIGKNHYQLLPGLQEHWLAYIQRGLQGEIITETDDSFISPDGSVQWINWEIQPWYLDEYNIGGVLIFWEDKTRTFEYQSERIRLLQKARLAAEKANHEKSQFLANMSHELRTPMHAILSFAHLGLKSVQDEKSERYFSRIRQSGQRLTGLLDNLLDLAKFESKNMKIHFEFCSLGSLITQSLQQLESLLKGKNLQVNVDNSIDLYAEVDKNLFLQVIINLLSNAIKFSDENSQIDISFSQQSWQYADVQLKGVQLLMRDYGIGVPATELDSIFDKFIQSSLTYSGAGGTGLGLSICKQIINAHHGNIYARLPTSENQRGTEFVIQLPQKQHKLHLDSIAKTIAFHQQILTNLDSMLTHNSRDLSIPPAILEQHELCHLHNIEQIKNLPSKLRAQFDSLHESIHSLSAQVVQLYQQAQPSRARELYQNLSEQADSFSNLLSAIQSQDPKVQLQYSACRDTLIMIAEDSQLVSYSIQSMLEAAGYKVIPAYSGDEASALLEKHQPDLLITDIYMPGKNGLKVIIDAHTRYPDLPVIAISSGSEQHESSDILDKSLVAGASLQMQKPIDQEMLLKNIKLLLNKDMLD